MARSSRVSSILICLSCFSTVSRAGRLVAGLSSESQVKSGRTEVLILTAAHEGAGGPVPVPIFPTLPSVWWSKVVSNTFTFSGGVGTSEEFDAENCKSSSYMKTWTKSVRLTHGFVQIAGTDRVRLWGDDNNYRSFHPWWGAYTPFWTREATNPAANINLISDAVLPEDGPNSGLFILDRDQVFSVDSSTGQVGAKLCSFPQLVEAEGEVHTASLPSEKSIVAAKNFNGAGRLNELFILGTTSVGTCSSSSWTLKEGEWFCGIAIDQASKKAYVLVEHHLGSNISWQPAGQAQCANSSRTVDRMSVYEISLSGAELEGHEVLQMPSFEFLAVSVQGHDFQTPLVGMPTLFLQEAKIWFLQLGSMMWPIQFAAPQVRAPIRREGFSCKLYGWDVTPTIWQGGHI